LTHFLGLLWILFCTRLIRSKQGC